MFGKSNKSNTGAAPSPTPERAPAVDMAKITGGGLVQLIVTDTYPVQFSLFLNQHPISDIDVDSISVNIVAPTPPDNQMIVRATLLQYVTNVAGERVIENKELFPCTFEVIAMDRRIAVSCMRIDSTDGLWVNVGLKPDGDSRELQGLKEFRFLLSHDMVDARITWVDGESESLFPQ